MANLYASIKDIRKTKRRTRDNDLKRKNIREARKAIEKAIKDKDVKKATELMPSFQKAIDKAAKTNLIHKNKAARLKSRMNSKVVAIK